MVLGVAPSTQLTPRPYQWDGIQWLKDTKRAMLTDVPGLGKTLQAALAAHNPTLVVAPAYLIDQWADFIKQQFPDDSVSVADGPRTQRQAAINKRADWTIVNVEMLGAHKTARYNVKQQTDWRGHTIEIKEPVYNEYSFHKYRTVIFDESHHFRGHKTSRAKKAVRIARDAEYVFLLTATPIVKEADDLFQQLQIIAPDEFTSYNSFLASYVDYYGTSWSRTYAGYKPRITRMLAKYALGRTYENVGMYLPPLIEKTITVRPSDHNRKKYNEVKNLYRFGDESLTSAIETLNMLRYITFTEEKVDALHEILDYDKRPTIVFTWFRETATTLHALFGGDLITGDMPPNKRKAVAQNSERVFATIASLCEGVDLSHAKVIAFFEEDYTPGRMHQALSRAHRAGANPDPVLCYYIHLRGTVDETVHKAVERRKSDVREILREALKQ